jgi:peptide/nickel transport system substrate-binding protein
MRKLVFLAVAGWAALIAGTAFAGGNLRVGLGSDPDLLDPARGVSYSGRIVFAAMCDKLVDVDAKLNLVPQLATGWAWSDDRLSLTLKLRDGVNFQDGEKLTADAVRANLERYRSAAESQRKSELRPIAAVEIVDPLTISLRLSVPYAPLPAVLADRSGMMVSPKNIHQMGAELGSKPVCAGPFKFVSRLAQDRIVLDRFPGYWDAARVTLDRITYQPFPDSTVRLVNLRSGQLDLIEGLAAADVGTVKSDPKLRLVAAPSIAYQVMLFNLGNGALGRAKFATEPRLREAFEMAIDRAVINQVVFEGTQVPSNQTEPPGSTYWNSAYPVPARDLGGAKALMTAMGLSNVPVQLVVGNSPIALQTAELIQSMAGEAGFDVKIQAMEANAAVAAVQRGEFNAYIGIWSGRPDPDGNVAIWLASDGFLNWGKYVNTALDGLLVKARAITDVPERQALYRDIAETYLQDRPMMVLYHQIWLFAQSDKVSGFRPMPDGLIRPQGITLKE